MTLNSEGPGPFRYAAACNYALSPGELTVGLSMLNRSEEVLPFGFGLHPWFPRTRKTVLWAPAEKVWLENSQYLPTIAVDPSDRPEFDFRRAAPLPAGWINNGYTGWTGDAEIDWPERGMGLKLLASAPFDCFQVYSPGREADFFCFEPVNHIADAFNHIALNEPGSAALVTPGQEVRGAIRFTAKV